METLVFDSIADVVAKKLNGFREAIDVDARSESRYTDDTRRYSRSSILVPVNLFFAYLDER